MTATYTTKHASELTGASRQAIRVYTTRYARYMSTEATPEAGSERRFTDDDLKLMAYIFQQTDRGGKTHNDVLSNLELSSPSGKPMVIEVFDWEPPSASQGQPYDVETTGTALVPIERLVAIQALLQAEREARQRDEDERQRLIDREQQLSERLEDLRQQLGEAQGELKAIKATRRKPPAWWVRIFGGGE